MSAALLALLTVIGQIAPSLGGAALTPIINTLIDIVPSLISEVSSVVPVIKNIIAALQSNTAITQDQWNALDTLNQQCDAAFETEASQFNPDGTPITPSA